MKTINWEQVEASPTIDIETVNDSDIFGGTAPNMDDVGSIPNDVPPATEAGHNNGSAAPGDGTVEMNLGALPAELVIGAMDSVMPPLMVIGLHALGYKQVTNKVFKLTAGDKAIMTPALEQYLKTVNVRLSPLEQLLLTVAFVYGGKVLPIVANEKPEKKSTNLNDTNEGASGSSSSSTGKRGRPRKS